MKKLLVVFLLTLPMVASAQIVGTTQPGVIGGGGIINDSGPRTFYKQSSDPAAITDRGKLYTKYNAVTGKVDLYYINDQGDVVQITTGGTTPVGEVEYAGLTTASYDGNDAGDYEAANDYCRAETVNFTGTADHFVCTVENILFVINEDPTVLPGSGGAWINGGPPGYTLNANDCQAWSDNSTAYGRFWNFADGDDGTGFLSPCGESKPYACCK